MEHSFIAIEGLIGSGKTTLAKMLATDLNTRLMLERFAENPFLEKFYKERERYAFSTEMSFMADRYQHLSEMLQPDIFQPNLISDFAPFKSLIFAQQNLTEVEFKLYRQFYNISFRSFQQPSLIVHLNRPTHVLLQLIMNRGRAFEREIDEAYLEHLRRSYMHYYKQNMQHKILYLNIDKGDFIKDEHLYKKIKEVILSKHSSSFSYMDMNKI